MKTITVWSCLDVKTKRWAHNHIEDGHVDINSKVPIGNDYQTKTWLSKTWNLKHMYLNNRQQVVGKE